MTTQFIVNHLWQSSCFALLAGLLAFVLRNNSPKIRYWVWLSASLKFLIPFALLVSLGSVVPRPVRQPVSVPAPVFPTTLVQIAEPFSTAPDATVQAPTPLDWAPVAMGVVWALGFFAITLVRCRSWWRVRAKLRTGTPIELPIPLRALVTPGVEEPGVVGFLRPVLVLPAQLLEHLNPRQLSAILTHELCHVRRRDNLFAGLHMVVEAIFWFHPLVWWIGSRLVEERELACDEEVLRMGCEPADYVEGILKVCRFYSESPLPCVSGVTGADVKKRMRAILAGSIAEELSRTRKAVLAMVGLAALAAPILIGVLTAPAIRGQDAPAPSTAAFEIADVHISPPGAFPELSGGAMGGGRYELRGATMVDLIRIAWRVEVDRIAGGPSWLGTDRFEIIAKAADTTPASAMPGLLQKLLADRFGLQVHPDQKPLPAYVLTAGKSPRLKAAKSGEDPGCRSAGGGWNDWKIVCHSVTMAEFVANLPQMDGAYFDHPPFDRTELQGRWDFDLKWNVTGLVPTPAGTSLFDAVDRQLGLRFEPRDVPMPVIVVDRVNRTPTPNAPGVSRSLPSAPTEFEAGIIKPSAPDTKSFGEFQPGGSVDLRAYHLQHLVAIAWGVTRDRVVDAPKWMATRRFDVRAKAPSAAPEGTVGAPFNLDAVRTMLRALLIDSFSMAVHTEERPIPVYEMVVSKPRLKKADSAERVGCTQSGGIHPGATVAVFTYTCRGTTMPQLAARLPQVLGNQDIDRPVVDATGLEGAWDFEFTWSPPAPAQSNPDGAPTLSEVGPPIKDALNQQLGLKLESRNRPMPVLVIDHVDENPKN